MKKIRKRILALLCVMALLLGVIVQGGLTSVANAAEEDKDYAREWKILDVNAGDSALTVVDTTTNTKKAAITNAGVNLPDDLSEGNLALHVKMNIEADADSLAIMNDASKTETYIELCNEQADAKERNWKLSDYGLQNGENDLLLSFAESGLSYGTDGKQAFAWDETINYFRFYTTAVFAENASCKVTISEINIVYTSVGLEFGEDGDDTYLQLENALCETPSTIEASIKMEPVENSSTGWTLAKSNEEVRTLNNTRFTVEDTYNINVPSEYLTTSTNLSESKLAVAFRFYSSAATFLGDGQLELNSSGKQNDASEIRYLFKEMAAVEQGWNYIVLPLSLFTKNETGGTVDMANLNYIKLYTDSLNGEFAISDIKLIVLEQSEKSIGIIGNAYKYESYKWFDSAHSFSYTTAQMGTTQGGTGEPEAGKNYAITTLDNQKIQVERKFDLIIPSQYQIANLTELKNSRLAVAFWLYSSVDTSLGADGQFELTSEGKANDTNEIRYTLRNMSDVKQGWNYIVLPLSLFEYNDNASIDLSGLNYLKFHTNLLTGTFAITDIEMIVVDSDTDTEWTIGNAYILNSFRWKGTTYAFNDTFGKMGITEGAEGEPEAGTIYSETTITSTGSQLKLFRYYDALNLGSYVTTDLKNSNLALEFWLYSSTGAEPFARADNQIELQNQTGGNDSNEARWKFNWDSLKTGWNHVVLPFKEATIVGNFDISQAGKLRIYTTGTTKDSVLRFSDFKFIVQDTSNSGNQNQPVSPTIVTSTYSADNHYMIFSNTDKGDEKQTALFVTNEGYLAYVEGNIQYTLENVSVSTGDWIDIAVVRSDDSITFYVDGIAIKSENGLGSNTRGVPSERYAIGADGTGNQVFKGTIADVRLWNDVRTADEINDNRVDKTVKSLTSNGLDTFDTSLIGSWFLVGDIQYVLETMPDNSLKHNHAVFCGSRANDWLDYDKTQYDFLYDENGEEDYWSMIFIPDIQNLVTGKYTGVWYQMTEWIADNIETENVKHVVGAGDSTWSNTDREYIYALNGFNAFTSSVSWSNMIGNHDYAWNNNYRDSARYNANFGLDYIVSTCASSTYKGSYEDPNGVSGVENSYYTFSVNGVKWMVLQLEYYPRQSVLTWANSILEDEKYVDCNVILTTHAYLDGNGDYVGDYMNYTANDDSVGGSLGASTETIWDTVVKSHTNVQLVLCGHSTNRKGMVATKTVTNDAGEPVEALMMNVQDLDMTDSNGADTAYYSGQALGVVNILRFSADGTQVAVQQYAPGYEKSFDKSSNAITMSLNVVQCMHKNEAIYNVDTPTENHTGYTGDTYCMECGVLVKAGTVIPATGIMETEEEIEDSGKTDVIVETEETNDNEKTDVINDEGVQTGDVTNVATWIMILTVSGIMVLSVLFSKKKRDSGGF